MRRLTKNGTMSKRRRAASQDAPSEPEMPTSAKSEVGRYRTRNSQANDLKKSKLSEIDGIDEFFNYAHAIADQREPWMEFIREALRIWKELVLDNIELRKALLAALGEDRGA